MNTNKFSFWHSIAGTIVIIAVEYLAVRFLSAGASIGVILAMAVVGSLVTIYVATEIIEEVKGAFHMILLLTAVVLQFVIFFAFEYLFLIMVQPTSFPTLLMNTTSLLLHSVMVFVFNPLYLPGTSAGRILLLIQTFAALGLAVFMLQNISQFRKKSLDKE